MDVQELRRHSLGELFFGCVSFFAYMDVGKGREQDAEAFVKRNELAFRRKKDHQFTKNLCKYNQLENQRTSASGEPLSPAKT